MAPVTTTVRGLSTEVPVGPANGLDHPSVVSCDDVDANPWTMTELTEIVMRNLADKKTEYVFELTANADALTIVCEEARVTLLQKDAGW